MALDSDNRESADHGWSHNVWASPLSSVAGRSALVALNAANRVAGPHYRPYFEKVANGVSSFGRSAAGKLNAPGLSRAYGAARSLGSRVAGSVRMVPGDPAVRKAVMDGTKNLAKKVFRGKFFTKTIPNAVAGMNGILTEPSEWAYKLAKAVPHPSGSTVAGKFGKAMFSRTGAQLGFAAQGMWDGGMAIAKSDLSNSMFNRDDLDKSYHNAWGTARTVLDRTVVGSGRAINTVLFGIPGMIPGLGFLSDDSYTDWDAEDSPAFGKMMEAVNGATSPDEKAKAVASFNDQYRSQLLQGKDVDGNAMWTTDSNGKVRMFTPQDGAKAVKAMDDAKAAAERERALRLVNPSVNIDAASVREGLRRIDAEYNSKADEMNAKYESFDSWAPGMRNVIRTSDRDKWAASAQSNLDRQWTSRRETYMKSRAYKDMIDSNRDSAMGVYSGIVPNMSPEERDARFGEFWDSQDDRYRENFDANEFRALVSRAMVAGSEPQNGGDNG